LRRFHERFDDLLGGAPTFAPMRMVDIVGMAAEKARGPAGGPPRS
jgi:hypothetical protein